MTAATPASAAAAKGQEAQQKSSDAEESYYSEEFDEEEKEGGDEPHFQSRSGRRKSSESGDGSAKAKRTGSGRNTNLHKEKLRTIEEDDSEQRITISPSASQSRLAPEESAKGGAPADVPVIPSLNLDQENLRQKATENMRQNVRRARE